jgi:hypothetical protein
MASFGTLGVEYPGLTRDLGCGKKVWLGTFVIENPMCDPGPLVWEIRDTWYG